MSAEKEGSQGEEEIVLEDTPVCGVRLREVWEKDVWRKKEHNACGRIDFTNGIIQPKSANSILQGRFCRFSHLQMSNPSKLVIFKQS